MQLLVGDRTHQRLIGAAAALNAKPRRPDAADQRGKFPVAPEMAQCFIAHRERLSIVSLAHRNRDLQSPPQPAVR